MHKQTHLPMPLPHSPTVQVPSFDARPGPALGAGVGCGSPYLPPMLAAQRASLALALANPDPGTNPNPDADPLC